MYHIQGISCLAIGNEWNLKIDNITIKVDFCLLNEPEFYHPMLTMNNIFSLEINLLKNKFYYQTKVLNLKKLNFTLMQINRIIMTNEKNNIEKVFMIVLDFANYKVKNSTLSQLTLLRIQEHVL